MDDMTSPSKFGEVTWPILDFTGRSVFYIPAFSAFYRLFCKIANFWDIDLKFSELISDANIDNPAIFLNLSSMSRSYIYRNQTVCVCLDYWIHNLQTILIVIMVSFDLVPPHLAWHLVKIYFKFDGIYCRNRKLGDKAIILSKINCCWKMSAKRSINIFSFFGLPWS